VIRLRLSGGPYLIVGGRLWDVGVLTRYCGFAICRRPEGTYVNFGVGQLRLWNR
jgi:hypothetical protein